MQRILLPRLRLALHNSLQPFPGKLPHYLPVMQEQQTHSVNIHKNSASQHSSPYTTCCTTHQTPPRPNDLFFITPQNAQPAPLGMPSGSASMGTPAEGVLVSGASTNARHGPQPPRAHSWCTGMGMPVACAPAVDRPKITHRPQARRALAWVWARPAPARPLRALGPGCPARCWPPPRWPPAHP